MTQVEHGEIGHGGCGGRVSIGERGPQTIVAVKHGGSAGLYSRGCMGAVAGLDWHGGCSGMGPRA